MLIMKQYSCIVTIFLLLFGTSVFAEPVDPSQRMVITLEDGTKVKVMPMGDEYGSCWMSVSNGQCYVKRHDSDYYERISMNAFQDEVKRNRSLTDEKREASLLSHIRQKNLIGQKRVPVILVEFADMSFEDSHDVEFYDEVLNQLGTKALQEGFVGSVRDYFLAQSNHQLELTFDVIGPVKLSQNNFYYGEDSDEGRDIHIGEFASEAIMLSADLTDFSLYDWDGDGIVEQIMFIYAWYGQNYTFDKYLETIWPQKNQLEYRGGSTITLDGVTLNDYACTPELRMINIDGTHQANGIGTFCHEFSHCLGLPDMYDGQSVNYGTNVWDLMATGGQNNFGFTPAGYTSIDKMLLGWQEPILLSDDVTIENIKPMSEGGDFYMIRNDGYDNEYYLLENRQQTGWDEKLPGHGMLILHVDYDEYIFSHNWVNSSDPQKTEHERCSIVVADNFSDATGTYRDKQRDVYPWEGNDSFTNTSSPSSTLYHPNEDNTFMLSKPVTNIHENGDGTMGFSFANEIPMTTTHILTCGEGVLRYTSDESVSYSVSIANSSRTNPYQRPIGAYLYVDGVLQESRDFVTKTILPKEKVEFEFHLSNLEEGHEYDLRLYYYENDETTSWTKLSESFMFNMEDRNVYSLWVYDDYELQYLSQSSVLLDVTIHNESFKPYTRALGAYTWSNGEIQEPSSFIKTPLIEPYSDGHFQFVIEGFEMYKEYVVSLYYYNTQETTSWSMLGGAYHVYIDESTETGIEQIDSVVSSLYGQKVKVYSLDGRYVCLYESFDGLNGQPSGVYILKPMTGRAYKVSVR